MWHSTGEMVTLGLIGPISPLELTILAAIGLLIFGKRLPEVGRSIGRGIVEFKRGLSGIEDDLDHAAKQPPKIEQHQTEQVDTPDAKSEQPSTDSNRAQSSA